MQALGIASGLVLCLYLVRGVFLYRSYSRRMLLRGEQPPSLLAYLFPAELNRPMPFSWRARTLLAVPIFSGGAAFVVFGFLLASNVSSHPDHSPFITTLVLLLLTVLGAVTLYVAIRMLFAGRLGRLYDARAVQVATFIGGCVAGAAFLLALFDGNLYAGLHASSFGTTAAVIYTVSAARERGT